jgi:hypothetical protein
MDWNLHSTHHSLFSRVGAAVKVADLLTAVHVFLPDAVAVAHQFTALSELQYPIGSHATRVTYVKRLRLICRLNQCDVLHRGLRCSAVR